MHNTNELLDALAAKHGGVTDYRLSKLLNTSTSCVTAWRKGRGALSQDFALRVAELLDWPAEYVLACVEHERAERHRAAGRDPLEQTDKIAAAWRRIAAHFRPKAAAIILAVAGSLTGSPKPAAALDLTAHSSAAQHLTPVYIMRSRKRRRRPWAADALRRWFGTWLPIASPEALGTVPA